MHKNFISVRSSAHEYPPKTSSRHSYSSHTRWISGLCWVAHLWEAALGTMRKLVGVTHNRRWDCKRVSVLSSLLLRCWRDTIVLGLYIRHGLPVKVLLGKGKVLGHSRFKPSCLVFGVHRDRNMKHNGRDKSCNRTAAPNVTKPCVRHSY